MNYFNIFLRIFTAIVTFAIGLALVGSPGASNPSPKPFAGQTKADALEAELEAMNAFYKRIKEDREVERTAQMAVEAAEEAASKAAEEAEVRHSNYAPQGDFGIILGNDGVFKSVESFYLISSRYFPEQRISKPIAPSGAISISGSEYEFKTITVDPIKVSFLTKQAKGVSYGFEGKVSIRYYGEGIERIVITGTLSKFLNGKRVFHDVVEFEEMIGC